ncbi:MBL fold metallo-hydrolase [Vibrio sp. T187]|uniref:MBL fold metallo-hydrolase n=1 Tax=Vibrio TaxID=662 RepID=UPI0010C9CD93|nr:MULTISPECIES: MBL fold metallo-hydrolase [Vibrio]MBW3698304.1 MBL fold metallo-hydrolase [Vibrio sp. T187]
MAKQKVQHFFHPVSGTISYVVSDIATKETIIIDPVADYNEATGEISFQSAQIILDYVEQHGFHVAAILETHIHADHLTGSFFLSEALGAPIHVSDAVKDVYSSCKDDLALSEMYEFENYLLDHEHLGFGESDLEVINTPGHTPSDLTYKIGDAIFVGDSLFFHGTGRADFPGGSAKQMFHSLSKLYDMDDETKVYLCHNYPKTVDELVHMTTIGEEKHDNAFLTDHTSESEFVALREGRDAQLGQPKLINPALTYNLTSVLPH